MVRHCYRAFQALVAMLDDEARHPKLALMNRRAFASLVSVIAIPRLLPAAQPDSAPYPLAFDCGCVNGDCDQSEGYHPDPSAGCSNFCGGPVTCPTAHCWCAPYQGGYKQFCDCIREGQRCVCAREVSGCGGGGGGRHPGELM